MEYKILFAPEFDAWFQEQDEGLQDAIVEYAGVLAVAMAEEFFEDHLKQLEGIDHG